MTRSFGSPIAPLEDDDLANVSGGSGGLTFKQLAAAEERYHLVINKSSGAIIGCGGTSGCEYGKQPPFQGSIYAKVKHQNGYYDDAKCYSCGKIHNLSERTMEQLPEESFRFA